ncbi:MAG: GxxExxY protein, partial [Opitutales bacterium]
RNNLARSRNGAEKREMTENKIRTAIIECAIEVHRELGPGLLETVYEVALLKDGIVRAVNGLEEHLCAPASLREKNKFQSALHSTRTSRASELYDMRERKMKFCKPQISQRAQRVRGEKKIT